MPLYKRVYPKWHEETWKQDKIDACDEEKEVEMEAQNWKPNTKIN